MTSLVRRLLPPALLAAPAVALLSFVPVAGAVPASSQAGPSTGLPPAECTPLDLTDEAAVEEQGATADDVFAGRVRAEQAAGSGRRVGYVVVVEEAFLGDVTRGQRVLVTIDWPAGTDPSVRPARSYVFFTTDAGGLVVADHCDGTALLRGGLTPETAAQLQRFLTVEEPTEEPTDQPEPVALRDPADPVGDPPHLGRVVASGAAISLIGVLGLVLVGRLGRRR